MSLGGHSLDQLARVRRLLQRFAVPDPRVHLISDAEAHVAAIEPELAVLHPAPFGGLENVEATDASVADGGPRDHRRARSSATPSEAARRQRRQEMLAPSKVQAATSKPQVTGTSKPASSQHTLATSDKPADKTRELNFPAQSKVQRAEPSKDSSVVQNQRTSVSKLSAMTPQNASKPVFALPVGPSKQNAKIADTEAPSDKKVELGKLVQRVMRKQRPARKQDSTTDPLSPSSLPTRARLHDATIIQQRPLPSLVVLPVSPASTSTSPGNALVVPEKQARNHAAELRAAPNLLSQRQGLEPARPRAPSQPTFFFNALDAREAADAGETLTDRIDQVLREQARRQGVDLT